MKTGYIAQINLTDSITDCWLHLINNGITITGDSVFVEWQGTGPKNNHNEEFTCTLDNKTLKDCEFQNSNNALLNTVVCKAIVLSVHNYTVDLVVSQVHGLYMEQY